VQTSVYDYVARKDKDLKLWQHFRARLRNSLNIIRERKERVVAEFEKMTELQVAVAPLSPLLSL
jgi:hypothetical protein